MLTKYYPKNRNEIENNTKRREERGERHRKKNRSKEGSGDREENIIENREIIET